MLQKLRAQGYDVGALPPSEKDLINTVLNNAEAKFNSTELNIAYRMKVGRRGGSREDGAAGSVRLQRLRLATQGLYCALPV